MTPSGELIHQAYIGDVHVQIKPDPLGDVNRIVTLIIGNRHVRSVLTRVPNGAAVKVGYQAGQFLPWLSGPGWRALVGIPEPEGPVGPEPILPCYYVEVDGRRVLEVPEHETYPPAQPQPLLRRLRHWTIQRAHSAADGLAGRLGHHREDACEEWNE